MLDNVELCDNKEVVPDDCGIVVSHHARKRIKERVGLKGEADIEKYAEKIFEKGVRTADKRIIERIFKRFDNGLHMDAVYDYVLFQDVVAVFAGRTLVTVVKVRIKEKRTLEKMRMKSNRNATE